MAIANRASAEVEQQGHQHTETSIMEGIAIWGGYYLNLHNMGL